MNKLANKFISRLKWLALCERFQLYQQTTTKYFELRNANVQRQTDALEQAISMVSNTTLSSKQLTEELNEIKNKAHITCYNKTMYNNRLRLLGACRPDYDVSPDLVRSVPEIKAAIARLAKPFGLTADLVQDNGFGFAYQLSLVFPTYFQRQVIRSCFTVYDAFATEYSNTQNRVQKRNLVSSIRVDPNAFRDVSTTSALLPSEDSLAEEVVKQKIKVIRLKASSWVESVISRAKEEPWYKAQCALLYSEDNIIDTLLQGSMDFLDVNDLASVNMVISESSQLHLDLLEKQQLVEKQAQQSKVYKTSEPAQDAQSKHEAKIRAPEDHGDMRSEPAAQRVFQTVSVTCIQEYTNNMYIQLSNALTGNTFRSASLATETRKPQAYKANPSS